MKRWRPGTDRRAEFVSGRGLDASGWPATMEGAVRSGYLAAEAVSRTAGAPERFLLPDIA